jgi:hypothetical protein
MTAVDYAALVSPEVLEGEDAEETFQLRGMLEEAREYLASFPWCRGITRSYVGFAVGGVVAVFLFEIVAEPEVDSALWVVTGDLPSAYFVTDDAPTPCDALRVYCSLVDEWIDAVTSRAPLTDVFPVAAEPSEENAHLLRKRVGFIRNEIIPSLEHRERDA